MIKGYVFCVNFMLIKIIAAIIFINIYCISFGQQQISQVEHLGSKDGLSVDAVETVLADSYGTIWVGTEEGLNRLVNGKVEVFNEYSDNGRLVGHSISALFEDSKGNIWIGDRMKGITVYNPKKNTWKHILWSGNRYKELQNKKILNFVEDNKGHVWAAVFPRTLISFYSPDSIHKVYVDKNTVKGDLMDDFYAIAKSPTNELLLNSPISGTTKFNAQSGLCSPYKIDGIDSAILPGNIEYGNLLKSHLGLGLIIKKIEAVYYIDYKTKTAIKLLNVKQHAHVSCFVDIDSSITIVQLPYIWVFDKKLKEKSFSIIDNDDLPILAASQNSVCKDRSGIIWIGTQTGLFKIAPTKQSFNFLKKEFSRNGYAISNNYVRSLIIDSTQTLWLGYRGGRTLDAVKLANSDYGVFPSEIKNIQLTTKNRDVLANCIYKAKDSSVLITNYYGIYRFKNDKSEFLWGLKEKYPLLSMGIWAIHQLEDSSFLLGHRYNYIYILDKELKQINLLEIEITSGEKWDRSMAIWDFRVDSKDNIWVLSSSGLFKVIKLTKNKIILEKKEQVQKNSLWAFCETRGKQIWAGTVENGIYCFDSTGKYLRNIGVKEGLPSISILALITDNYGDIWASTPSSILRIRIVDTTLRIKVFNYQNGIDVGNFNHRAVAKDKWGNLYFGSKSGVLYFNPGTLKKKTKVASPFLFIHKVESENLLINGLSFLEEGLILNPNQRTLLFEPALIDYTNVKENRYFYFLEGLDDKWHEVKGESPQIQYTQLPSGNYVLHIKAVNSLGFSSQNQLNIAVIVTPHFWETTWFIIVVILCSLAAIGVFIYLALNTTVLQRRLMSSEIASLRSQMNPHFFFNALNSIQDFIFHQERRKAADFMSSFAKLLRSILENSSKKFISLNEEVSFLKLYLELESLRFEGVLKYTISVDSSIDGGKQLMPPMLLQPLIENAIKHGLTPKEENLRLTIEFKTNKNRLQCVIRDNGVGRKEVSKNGGHNSKGLAIVKERLALLNKLHKKMFEIEIIDLKDTNGDAAGTEVVIFF